MDGDIGRCKDFLFDDEHWTVRYMVADTGKWLPKQKVLISPISLGKPDWASKRFPVNMTKEMIEGSPPLDSDAPVSREYEMKWFEHHGWAVYWGGAGVWGAGANPATLIGRGEKKETVEQEPGTLEKHLRSVNEIEGYHIDAKDGEIGHVEDFIIDDVSWTLRYIVVDTKNWLPGRKVLVSPRWIESVKWHERKVSVDLTRQGVENSPEYDFSAPVNREYEERLYDYYGFPKDW